jgi:Icc-related predicted phosphoesterase
MRITLISDTHTKHLQLRDDLPGGDLLIHSGDHMNSGHILANTIKFGTFLEEMAERYSHIVYIAGNHDFYYQDNPDVTNEFIRQMTKRKPNIHYLQDSELVIKDGLRKIRIYGSPWQPEFYNWAFNLPRNGEELKEKWDNIPKKTDILVTHGPPYGTLDTVEGRRQDKLGCELLEKRINEINPKISVFGHIHSSHGHKFKGKTHYFNASNLNERYQYEYKPITFDWNSRKNEITMVNDKS